MFYCEITDTWESCPGIVTVGPFQTRKEAQWYGEHEMTAADELFTDGRANLTVRIFRAEVS